MMSTSHPRFSRASARCDPINPDPPVISAFISYSPRDYTVNVRLRAILSRVIHDSLSAALPSEYRLEDNRKSVSDISKLMELGWCPMKPLEDIFEDYFRWPQSIGDLKDYLTDAENQMRRTGVIRRMNLA